VQLGPIKVEVIFAYSKTQEANTEGSFGEVNCIGNLRIIREITSKYHRERTAKTQVKLKELMEGNSGRYHNCEEKLNHAQLSLYC